MSILPDVSASYRVLSPDLLSDDELIDETHRVLRGRKTFSMAAGHYFLAQKERFQGKFLEIVEMKFDESIDTIEAWMAITKAFPDPKTWKLLPSAWSTLVILARIPEPLRG